MMALGPAVQAAFVAIFLLAFSASANAATTNVNATAVTTFAPATVSIKPGDTVQWTWTGNSHSTTSTSVPALWDSGIHNQPFSFSFTFTNSGNYPYHCSNPLHSSMIGSVVVTNRPPIVTITNPPNNSVFTAPASFLLGASASDPDGAISQVEFFRGTTSLGMDTSSPYNVNVTSLAAGSYTFSAVASGDGTGKATNSINVTVNAANAPPSVTITNPPNNAVFNAPGSFTIGAIASDSDGSVTNVEFFRGTTSLGNDNTSPYGAGVVNLAAGAYTLSAVASDNQGAKATNSVNVTINALPTVTITNPPSNATFAAPWNGPIFATASDTDGSIARVQFFSDAVALGIVSNAPFSLAVNLAAGTHALTAVAMDNQGATNTSAPVGISVVTPAPIILSNGLRLSPTQFRFTYSANTGLTYIIERSQDLSSFSPLKTNMAQTNNVMFIDDTATNPLNVYRVGRLPNP